MLLMMTLGSIGGCASAGQPTVANRGTDTVLNFSRGRSSMVANEGLGVAPTELAQPVGEVWPALLKALTALDIPVDVVDERSWTAGTPATQAHGDFAGARLSASLACGGAAGVPQVADSYAVTIGVLATLEPIEGGTSLVVKVAGSAKDRFTSVPARHCDSRGTLEAKVDSTVRAILATP